MENHKKCSAQKHSAIDAVHYCMKCQIYMCNKCSSWHSELFDHPKYELNDKQKEIFTNICNEKNHRSELNYYCKDHNQLCCVCCIAKVVG